MITIALPIDSFQDIGLPEDEMPSANPLDESELQKQVPQVVKADFRIRTTTGNCAKSLLTAPSHASNRIFSQTPNVGEAVLLQDDSEVGLGHLVGEGTVTKDNGAVTNREEFVVPVGAKGQQRDGLPDRGRLFSDTRRYGGGGQEDNAIGKGWSGRHCAQDVKLQESRGRMPGP